MFKIYDYDFDFLKKYMLNNIDNIDNIDNRNSNNKI